MSAFNLESVAQRTSDDVDHTHLEESHECLRGYTEVFTKNVLKTKDFTYHILMGTINNKSLDLVTRDKDSSVGIIDKPDYSSRFHWMIE